VLEIVWLFDIILRFFIFGSDIGLVLSNGGCHNGTFRRYDYLLCPAYFMINMPGIECIFWVDTPVRNKMLSDSLCLQTRIRSEHSIS
jgi:hypothetical protein